ncbi:hypothetical protein ART_0470 [Arthrobacter sp. PAMC 25486]|nr:hypothetical protein ART_0470 [Arthrobacter sp. PAMC 25486]
MLVFWIIQVSVGISLLVSWWRHGRRGAAVIITHVASVVVGLGLWIAFLLSSALWPAWAAFALLNVGNGFGDAMLVGRHRSQAGPTASYLSAILAVVKGWMPPRVTFHALFAGVVYFSCLGVCLGATVAALG